MVWKATDAGSCPSCCGRTIAAPRVGPRRQLIDGRSAEGVGGADDDGTTIALEELRELADRGRLADAVDSHDEDDRRALGEPERRVELREMLFESLFEHPLEVTRIRRAEPLDLLSELVDDPLGDVRTEVGGEQCRFEIVPRVVVDRRLHKHAAQSATERPGILRHAFSLRVRGTRRRRPAQTRMRQNAGYTVDPDIAA
jgi:hypothetical protein